MTRYKPMKTHFYLVLFLILFTACNKSSKVDKPELQDYYAMLDAEIEKSKEYEDQKNNRITAYKRDYDLSTDKKHRTELINKLIKEFDEYNADSALYYISYNLKRPAVKDIPGEYTRLLIKKGDVYAHAGLFADAFATLQSIPRDSLTIDLLDEYYTTYCALYQYLTEYTSEHQTALEYDKRRSIYADSLSRVIKPESFNHLVFIMTEKARNGETDTAIQTISKHLEEFQSGTREYSILASTLADIYKTAGFKDDYKRYLILSAISDIRGAVKENMSFREVATVMFENGDVERANRYLKKSIADANFYSAIMRNAQSIKMLPVIDEAYMSVQNKLTNELRAMVWVSSILLLILLVTLVFILKQIKSLRRAKDNISVAAEELSHVSGQLREANHELKVKNDELHEYAVLFMEYCSSTISSLQHYQQSLRKLTVQGGNRNALLSKLESTEMVDQLLKDFYRRFDEAILNIYPSFVEKFNKLLKPDEQIVLKSGEILNTELRLFALIRLGIDDNAKAAEFLRCSTSTVYTYRSKTKKRALDPDNFENDVRNLS
ncbi:MAG: hypothetical protein K2H59_01480 [Muribaculaceae bacterium]|nr:hypothetical protein [Muribaculaceae bacterium]